MIYRKVMIFALIFFILTASIVPSFNAYHSETIEENEKEEESKFFGFGFIYGRIGTYVWSGWGPLYDVEIDAGIRKKICGGHYVLCFLPLDRSYTITASKEGWETETREITLTNNNRIERLDFTLRSDDNYQINVKHSNENSDISFYNNDKMNLCKSLKFGLIFGNTQWMKDWSGGPIMFTRIVAIGEGYYREKHSGFLGIFFLITPLDKEICITASKIGYETETISVTLTEKNRFEYVSITLNEI